MPYCDGTGPYGDGPRMGRGKRRGGFFGFFQDVFGRRGYGYFRGFGRRWIDYAEDKELEKSWIESRIRALENELRYWKDYLRSLEKSSYKEENRE